MAAAPSLPVTFFDRLFEVLDSTPEEGRMIVIQLLVAQGRKAKIEDVLAWVNSKTAEELSGMEKHKLMAIGTLLRDNPQDFQKFLLHKNIKLFGSVDAYVTDFLTTKDTVGRILAMPAGAGKRSAIDGAKVLLGELEIHPDLSAEKKAEVTAALERLRGAAGGKRSDRKSRRRGSQRRGSRRQTRRQRRSFTAKRRV
jgi:hypothetical protein